MMMGKLLDNPGVLDRAYLWVASQWQTGMISFRPAKDGKPMECFVGFKQDGHFCIVGSGPTWPEAVIDALDRIKTGTIKDMRAT